MQDDNKTRGQLINELENVRKRIAELEKILAGPDSKRFDRQTRELLHRLEMAVRQSLDGIAVTDLEGLIQFVNQSWVKIHGFDNVEELIGRSISMFHTPEQIKKQVSELYERAQQIGAYQAEVSRLRRDGSILVTFTTVTVLKNESGDAVGLVWIAHDITRYKRAEQALKESEEVYRTLVETSPFSVTVTDLEGNLIMANKTAAQMHGFNDPEEMLGLSAFKLIAPKDRQRAQEVAQQTFKQGMVRNIEYTMLRQDGSFFYAELNAALICDSEGNPKSYIGIVRDITERKLSQELISESEQRFRALSENSLAGVYIMQDNQFVYVNPALADIFGYRRDELEGKLGPMDLVHPEDRAIVAEQIRRRMSGETDAVNYIVRGVRKDGVVSYWEILGRKVDYQGKTSFIGTVLDVTQRKKAEELKDEFVITVSHELRAPLAIIKEGINLFLDGIAGKVSKQQKHILDIAADNINRLSRTINNLLDISRIESGRISFKKSQVNFNKLVKDVAANFSAKVKEKKLKVNLKLPHKPVYIYLDSDRLVQVFTNLMDNAIKFTDKGKIIISVEDSDAELKCIVSDTGFGIHNSDLPKVFNKFQQFGNKPGLKNKGTGLGLSIVKGIIDNHGGTIKVESKLSKGTQFTFILPKYTVNQVLGQYLNQCIKESFKKNKNITLVILNVAWVVASRKKQELKQLRYEIEQNLKRRLRRSDDMIFSDAENIFAVLTEQEDKDTALIEQRFKEAALSPTVKKRLTKNICFKIGLAVFSQDAQTEKELIDKAFFNLHELKPR